MYFKFLHPYKINPLQITADEAKETTRKKHLFFPVLRSDFEEALKKFDPFPVELKAFYKEIGFGFFHRKKGKLNILLDPISLVNINLQLGYYKNDSGVSTGFQFCDSKERLLFFKTHEGLYFSIAKTAQKDKNAVYYNRKQITGSLYDFLYNYNQRREYLADYIDDLWVHEKTNNKEKDPNYNRTVKRIGGHKLIDPY